MATGADPPSIRLYDSIGQSEAGTGTSAEQVSTFLAANRKAPSVEVRINSTGGLASEGVAMFNALRAFPGEVVTINDSFALSAAALVFLAGNRRLMSPGSYAMIHRASAKGSGNAETLRKAAAALEVVDQSVAGMMAERIGRTAKDVLTMMTEETWFTVDEAIRQKVATGRTGTSPRSSTMQAADLSRFMNVPAALVPQWKNAATSAAASSDLFAIKL